jgi:hypothetical protein
VGDLEGLSPADIEWLRDQKEGGHCGEGTFEYRARMRHNDRIDRLLAALAARSEGTKPVPGWRLTYSEPQDADTPLMAAAREAGWALMENVDLMPWERRTRVVGIAERLAMALNAARSEGPKAVPGWRPIASAPKDGTFILARLAQMEPDSRWAHLSGRCFVVRHEGQTSSGFDLGWSVYPGLGGAPDWWLAAWAAIPAAAPPPPEGSKLLGDVEGLVAASSERDVAYTALGIALAALQHIQGMEPITQEITLPTVMAQHAVDALNEIKELGATSCPNPCGECRGVVVAGKCGSCGWEVMR